MREQEPRPEQETKPYIDRLFPLNRSLSGEGVRETYRILQEIAPFQVNEVPSGTRIFDWTVPDEWNVRDAYVEDNSGQRVVDFKANNLHLVGYSTPIDEIMPLSELEEHLHSLPPSPDAIPYRTSYYKKDWGFCLSHNKRQEMQKGDYHVKIDSELKPGSITLGEAIVEGWGLKEYIISTYSCHPSMANDNLSGMLVWAQLLKELRSHPTRHTYHFLIGPETIGALAWLSRNPAKAKNISGAIVLTSLAGWGDWAYKKSFQGDSEVDNAVGAVFKEIGFPADTIPFNIKGSDERQFSSPQFRIPTAYMCKPALYSGSEYHTSRDSVLSSSVLSEALNFYKMVIARLEMNRTYERDNGHGEPMMAKYGLYPNLGAQPRETTMRMPEDKRSIKISESSVIWGNDTDALMWMLFYADGETDLFEISRKSGLPTIQLNEAAQKLTSAGLLKEPQELSRAFLRHFE